MKALLIAYVSCIFVAWASTFEEDKMDLTQKTRHVIDSLYKDVISELEEMIDRGETVSDAGALAENVIQQQFAKHKAEVTELIKLHMSLGKGKLDFSPTPKLKQELEKVMLGLVQGRDVSARLLGHLLSAISYPFKVVKKTLNEHFTNVQGFLCNAKKEHDPNEQIFCGLGKGNSNDSEFSSKTVAEDKNSFDTSSFVEDKNINAGADRVEKGDHTNVGTSIIEEGKNENFVADGFEKDNHKNEAMSMNKEDENENSFIKMRSLGKIK